MMTKGTRIVGYCRTSTDEQANGVEAQRQAIESEAARKGWLVVSIVEEHASAKRRSARPILDAAITLVESGAADALVVSKLDRLSRSLVDFGQLAERAKKNEWALVVLSPDLDMTSSNGRMLANVLMTFAEWERDMISERTTDALAVKRARGERIGGRPSTLPEQVVARIRRQAGEGVALNAIAKGLNQDAIPTGQGGKRWYASSVQSVLRRVGDLG